MFNCQPYLNFADGERKREGIIVSEQLCENGMRAVFVHGTSEGAEKKEVPLAAGCGACVEIRTEKKITRLMADYRHSQWWCRPYFGNTVGEIPGETQLLVLEEEDGTFCVAVPVVNETYRCVFRGMEENIFLAEMSSDYEGMYECSGLSFVYGEGKNPTELITKCVKAALQILNHGVRHISERRYPEMFEYLGWCTWDSMQIRVNEEGILHKCREFQEKKIPVQWMILDDMWAYIKDFYGKTYENKEEMIELMHGSRIYNFEADPIRFPGGLKDCIQKVKEFGIHVGIWYPTTGYWKGFDPEGPAYEALKEWLICTEDGLYVPDWRKEKSYGYHKALQDFFRACGADFVKIDKQSMSSIHYKNLAPVGEIARAYHSGMEASVGEHFDNSMINCMGLGSEDIWNRSVSPISRCSDDFQPEDAAWFTKHILQCAYNSLLQGQFCWCDWDMWWTDDSQAAKNSMIRAVSGGPVYVSDELDRSRKEVLEPLMLGSGRILRCDRPAIPTADCITRNPVKEPCAIKIQNMAGNCGIMAVLNIHENNCPVSTVISGRQVDGFEAEEYVVYDYFAQSIRILKAEETFELTLSDRDDYRLYIFSPLQDGFAAIGRTDKFISPKTIRYVHGEEIVLWEEGHCAWVKDGELHIRQAME